MLQFEHKQRKCLVSEFVLKYNIKNLGNDFTQFAFGVQKGFVIYGFFYLQIRLFTIVKKNLKSPIFQSKCVFLSTNSLFAVQNSRPYLPPITRPTCLLLNLFIMQKSMTGGQFHQTLCAYQKVLVVKHSAKEWLFSFINFELVEFRQITVQNFAKFDPIRQYFVLFSKCQAQNKSFSSCLRDEIKDQQPIL